MILSSSGFGIGCTLVATVLALNCGGGSGGGSSSGGPYSWSVSVTDSNGQLSDCVNYINTPKPPTNVMGGTVSTDPCPVEDDILGTCSGVDQGGNDYVQVFYGSSTVGTGELPLNCSALGGTFSTATYVPPFGPGSSGRGTGGSAGTAGSGGTIGTGGSSGATGSCAQLQACCNAATSTYKTACMAAYDATNPSETSCQAAYGGLKAAYCPAL